MRSARVSCQIRHETKTRDPPLYEGLTALVYDPVEMV